MGVISQPSCFCNYFGDMRSEALWCIQASSSLISSSTSGVILKLYRFLQPSPTYSCLAASKSISKDVVELVDTYYSLTHSPLTGYSGLECVIRKGFRLILNAAGLILLSFALGGHAMDLPQILKCGFAHS